MAVMDEFKAERQALKNGSRKAKLLYFWDYYKWHTIVTIVVIAFAVTLVHNILTQKDMALNGVMLNSIVPTGTLGPNENDAYTQEFAEYAGIDLEEFDIRFDVSLYISEENMDDLTVGSAQKLMIYVAAAELDVLVSPIDTFQRYAYQENFHDLRNILTAEQLEAYAPYIYYIDAALVEEIEIAYEEAYSYYVPDFPDPTRPEEMKEPIPVGIYTDSCTKLHENYVFTKKPVVLGVYCNAPNVENASKYIDFMMLDAQ